jgi:NAD(P)-dependent dehydrogenase (short-subunit alcohol dehydrogenase family)
VVTNMSVVITGASTGIGRDCALHLDKIGWRVFAGVRKQADAESLRDAVSGRLAPLILDVTDAESIKAAVELIEDAVSPKGLSGLVNNAGIGRGGPQEFLDLADVRETFEVNFFGVIAVTRALLPLLRAGQGRIVNMSSISGLVAAPFLSPYSASKFALEALSDALRLELSPWNIHVAIIEPGAIDTPIWTKSEDILKNLLARAPRQAVDLYGGVFAGLGDRLKPHGISPKKVTNAVAHALVSKHPKTRYAIGAEGQAVRLARFLPDRLRDAMILSGLPKWGGKK